MLLFRRWLVLLLGVLALAGCSTVPEPSLEPEQSAPGHPLPAPVQPNTLHPPAHSAVGLNNIPPVVRTNVPAVTNVVVTNAVLTNSISTNAVASTNSVPAPLKPVHVEPVHVEPMPEWVDMNRWSGSSGWASLTQQSGGMMPRYALRSSRGSIDFTAKSQIAHWNGLAFMLGFPPQVSNGKPYVHNLDLQNSILPLLQECNCAPAANRIVVIDPGHGGDQPGSRTVVGNCAEKDLTLDWALRIRSMMTNQGWKVYLTRTNDVDVTLTNRVAIADSLHADLFISLHFNSFSNPDQNGLETYCLTPAGMPSNLVRGWEDQLAQTNNAYNSSNLCWAMRIHRQLVLTTHGADRGVRRARFMAVLRSQKRPAILIEGGYLSNRKEAKQIITEAYRQKLAESVVKALLNQ